MKPYTTTRRFDEPTDGNPVVCSLFWKKLFSVTSKKHEKAGKKRFYSLNGQKVKEPRKGIYIAKGEKRIFE